MHEGNKEEIIFSGNQKSGQKIAVQYMEAVTSFLNLEKELPKDRNMWTVSQLNNMEEIKEVVEHYRNMPIILEFHILIEDLQRSKKKTQKQKQGVTFWDQAHQELPTTTGDSLLNLPPLSPRTETPAKTMTSAYHDTGG